MRAGEGRSPGSAAGADSGIRRLQAGREPARGMVSPSADLPRLLTQRHVSDCSPFMCGPRLNAAAGSWKQTCLAPRQQKLIPGEAWRGRGSLGPQERAWQRALGSSPLGPREGTRALSAGEGGWAG